MNFNFTPYNDSFSKKNKYYRVLFKPGFTVQARELNETQSMVQNQVSSIGNHLFKNGSKISGCSSAFVDYDYVRLNDNYDNLPINVKPFNLRTIKLIGSVSKVEANIIDVSEKNADDPHTLFVIYTKTGIDNIQSSFIPGEDVEFYDENSVLVYTATVRCPTCPGNTGTDTVSPTGKSKFFTIEEGVYYYNGTFAEVDRQKCIVEKYLTYDSENRVVSSLTYRVGLDIVESIIDAIDDPALFDNHLGYPNYAAPGADRYKLELKLVVRPYVESENESNFIMIARARQNHIIEIKKDDTEYAEIMKELARRTYESTGNFTVNPWKARFYNEKKNSANDSTGWSLNGVDERFVSVISPGIGYVQGYRVENVSETPVVGRKARDTKKLRGVISTIPEVASLTVSVSGNISWINHALSTTFTTQQFNLIDSTNASIGSFRVYDIYRVGATSYKLFIHSLTMLVNKNISMATGVRLADNSFSGTVPAQTILSIENGNSNSLVFPLGYKNIKSIRDNDNNNNGNTTVQIRRRFIGTLDSNGSITFVAGTNETIVNPSIANPICWVGSNPTGTSIAITNNFTYSGNSLTLNLGSTHANKSVTYISSVIRTSQTEKSKTLTNHTYTTSARPDSTIGSTIVLPYADGYRLEKVTLVNVSDPTVQIDVTSEYDFANGQTDNFYTPATLTRKVVRTFGNDNRLIISFLYFEHSGTAGYFTVDSYAQLIQDPNLDLEYGDIPSYVSATGIVYNLAECIDFRPIRMNVNDVPVFSLPTFNSNVTFDVEYYLPRSDLLLVNTSGEFYLKEGNSSDTPSLPSPDTDAMPIYEVYVGAYTYTLNDIRIKYIDNKRFLMKDISALEQRIENVEYYVSLNQLEQQTVNMSIKDQDGFDRYKNGFLTDNFKGYYAADLNNVEFNAALDRSRGELRPQFKQDNIRLKFDVANSIGIKTFGNIAMADFDHDLFISNTFATQDLSINPYMTFRRNGTVKLSPNIDTWSDTNFLPTVVTNIDTGVEALRTVADKGKITGTEFGTWVDFNRSIVQSVDVNVTTTETGRSVVRDVVASGTTTSISGNILRVSTIPDLIRDTTTINSTVTTTRTTNTATTIDSSRVNTVTSIGSRTQTYTMNDIVKDVSIIPYVRPRTVQVYASNLKPNTRVYAYFDGINVTQHCRLIREINDGNGVLVNRSAVVFGGAPLVSDANGNMVAEFRIPANTFFTGDKRFVLTSDPENSGNADVELTRAECQYFAGGVSQTKQSFTQNVTSPTFESRNETENRSTTSVSRDTVVTSTTKSEVGSIMFRNNGQLPAVVTTTILPPAPRPAPSPPIIFAAASRPVTRPVVRVVSARSSDPVAQSFKVTEPCFISKFGVYFSAVDLNTSDTVWFEIRDMVNGYPSNNVLIRKEVRPSELIPFVSNDASKEYQVEFSHPIFVDVNKTYCLVVGGYSPETRLYISRLGEKLLGNPDSILEEPPLLNTMFRSLNGETWNAQQLDTMKFNLYRCAFKNLETQFRFYNENEDAYIEKCEDDPIQVQTGTNKVRIYCKNHDLRVNDRVTLDFNTNIYYTVEVVSGMPQIDQPVSTLTGTGYVTDIKITNTLNFYEISIGKVEGTFALNQEMTFEPRQYQYRDLFVMGSDSISTTPITQNQASGYVRELPSAGIPSSIGGASLASFAKEHIVKAVDSIDTFIIEVNDTFTSSGRFGGNNVSLFGSNIKYDLFNISGQFLDYNSTAIWAFKTYNQDGTATDFFNIKPLTDVNLLKPGLILSGKNDALNSSYKDLTGSTIRKSMDLYASFLSNSPYISPVFNTDSLSITTISNRISMINVNEFNQLPGTNRYVEETDPKNGSESYKYITSKAMLENAAVDMRVLFEVYCPKEGDFDVYVKIVTPQNNVDDSTLPWIKFDNYTKKRSSTGITDKIEYDLTASTHCTTWNLNNEYISFRVKLVGKSTNSCQPVIFYNLRAIAIT